jgi:hypothetical protein
MIYTWRNPLVFTPLAESLLPPFFVPLTYLETLLAVTGSVHLGLRLLVNWPPLSQPFPTPSPLQIPSIQVNKRLTMTTSRIRLLLSGTPTVYRCSQHGFTYIRGWMQMVLAPNDLFSWNNNIMNTMHKGIYTYCWLCTLTLTLCMIVSKSRDEVVFLASTHLVTSSHLPFLDSTDAHWPPLGAMVPPPPKWHPFPQDPRTLPFQGPAQ